MVTAMAAILIGLLVGVVIVFSIARVLFGSDACSDTDSALTDWEEKEFLMTGKARRALAIALTAMLQNGEITRERALEIARQVMRDNAMRLYGLAAQ